MDQALMKSMLDLDDHHWWYRGRRRIIRSELDRLPLPPHASVLDAGCGSGRTLIELTSYGDVQGIELDPGAAEVARGRGVGEVRIGRLEELPWDPDTFDLITCLDVIEHTPDDRATLTELAGGPGGRVAADHRACLPGAVVSARRGQPSLPPLFPAHAMRRGRGIGMDAATADLVQQPAAGTGRRGARGPAVADLD
jgi:SAM-dependent methyltransferase